MDALGGATRPTTSRSPKMVPVVVLPATTKLFQENKDVN